MPIFLGLFRSVVLSIQPSSSVELGLIFKGWGCGEQEVRGGRSKLVEKQALDL